MGEDEQLLAAYARRGDVQALSTLVVRHTTWLMALLRGLTPSRQDAEDAFQETWMRVIKASASYRGGCLRAYLARAARSVAVDRFRRADRATVSADAPCEQGGSLADTLADPAPTPDDACEARATHEDVRAAVRGLPEGPRTVLLMRVEAERSFREIASELDIPLGTALTWMRTATLRLKKTLSRRT